ncbi:MAG: NTP transferase domain-containing protein [Bacteroidales bacterium]|nr:NTP transferase domain-containing protein [Bacteroidales bacterium]
MKAMIFAAGVGSRLGEITRSTPKALVDIGGTTPLKLAVERLSQYGFNEIVVNIHHHAEMMAMEIKKLSKHPVTLTLSDESDGLLDTGGGLFKARQFFDDQPFILYNVDIINSIDLGKLYNFHLRKGGLATLAVRHRSGNRFLLVDKEGSLQGWTNRKTGKSILVDDERNERNERNEPKDPNDRNKQNKQNKRNKLNDRDEQNERNDLKEVAFSGIHVASPEIFNHMQEGTYSMISLYLTLLAKGRINTFLDDTGYCYDIGSPEKLEEVRKFMQG